MSAQLFVWPNQITRNLYHYDTLVRVLFFAMKSSFNSKLKVEDQAAAHILNLGRISGLSGPQVFCFFQFGYIDIDTAIGAQDPRPDDASVMSHDTTLTDRVKSDHDQ
jgi:hypothetical protein